MEAVDPTELEDFLLACLQIVESDSQGELSLPGNRDKKNN